MPAIQLTHFHCIRPPYELSQEDLLNWIASAHTTAEKTRLGKTRNSSVFYSSLKERLFRLGLGKGKVEKRGTVLSECSHLEWEKMSVYQCHNTPSGLGIKERMEIFEEAVEKIFELFYPDGCLFPSHLIHVSCTGYVAPSGAQKIVAKRKMGSQTTVTHAYHMGCYAAIPALRMALGFLLSRDKEKEEESCRADIVHTEVCSLHMNPSLHDTGQLVVQSLFADGFIKYSARIGKENKIDSPSFLRLLSLHEEILSASSDFMSWRLEEWGMRMFVGKEVPVFIVKSLRSFLGSLVEKASLNVAHVQNTAFFAIHPGGPKILHYVQDILGLTAQQVKDSQDILQACGNMSSATLPHIWQKMLENPYIKEGDFIVSLAFGPGLTLAGALFQKGEYTRC